MQTKRTTAQGFTLIELLVAMVMVGFIIIGLTRFSQLFFSSYEFSFQETQAISEAQYALVTMDREIREMRDGVDGAYPLATTNDSEIVFYSDVDDDGVVERVRYYLVGTDLVKQVFEYVPGISNYACVNGCDICHDPDGTNELLSIPESSWPAHRAHGDYLGACSEGGGQSQQESSDDYERIVATSITNGSNPIFRYYNSSWPADSVNNPLPTDERLLNTRMVEILVTVNINPAVKPDDFTASTFVHLRNLKDNL